MKKDAKATKRLSAAISDLAGCYPYGELEASVDPAGLLTKAAAEIRRLRDLVIEAGGYITATDKDGEYAESFRNRIRPAALSVSNTGGER